MNAPGTMLRLWLLAGLASGCTDGTAMPIVESAALGSAGAGRVAGSGAGRGGAGGSGGISGRAGSGGPGVAGVGGRSELQAGNGGERGDFLCNTLTDPVLAASETELLEALNVAIENKTFCPAITRRLSMDPGSRCFARDVARDQCSDRMRGRPLPPGWSPGRDLDFWWFAKQTQSLAEAREALLGGGLPDRRQDLCEAAQQGTPFRFAGVAHVQNCWFIVLSDR